MLSNVPRSTAVQTAASVQAPGGSKLLHFGPAKAHTNLASCLLHADQTAAASLPQYAEHHGCAQQPLLQLCIASKRRTSQCSQLISCQKHGSSREVSHGWAAGFQSGPPTTNHHLSLAWVGLPGTSAETGCSVDDGQLGSDHAHPPLFELGVGCCAAGTLPC